MGYGVFVYRSDSIYDDNPAEIYQFPRQYLGRVESCVGDWIIYYEPRKVAGTRGYFAMAKIERVIPDPEPNGMYLALIEHGSYLDFVTPVPFSSASGVAEQSVLNEHGRISGRAQSAVRPITPSDFHRIVALGLNEGTLLLPRVGEEPQPPGLRRRSALHVRTRSRSEKLYGFEDDARSHFPSDRVASLL